jgi:hypothetical protein
MAQNGISEACPRPGCTQHLLQCPNDFEKRRLPLCPPCSQVRAESNALAYTHNESAARSNNTSLCLTLMFQYLHTHNAETRRFRNTHPPSPSLQFALRLGLGLVLRFTFGTILNPALTAGSMRGCLRPIRNKRERPFLVYHHVLTIIVPCHPFAQAPNQILDTNAVLCQRQHDPTQQPLST